MAGWITVTVPAWWNERRYGLLVHASIATVPSFSPIGQDAAWYWNHLGTNALPGGGSHPSPMPEVLAYHRDRWGHVQHYDDFISFLSYHRFDADEHVELAGEAGMSYLVHVAKHHDGFCWWDATGTSRTSVQHGPHRDVIAEVAAACRRAGMLFGTYYSLLDWSAPPSPPTMHGDIVCHQVLDLVERYGSQILWGDRSDALAWPTDELIARAQDVADARGLELVINDRWGHPLPDFATSDGGVPDGIDLRPWELRRSLGSSLGHNRAERAEHLLTTGRLFDLLIEVIAKGGHLLVDVGPGVDGRIPDIHKTPLREVGAWIRAHPDILRHSRPFDQWGDAQVRYVCVGDDVVAIDLSAGWHVTLSGLTPDRYDVSSIEADDGGTVHWEQHRGGVSIHRIDRSPAGLAGVYRIRLQQAAEVIRLFEAVAAEPEPLHALQPLLDAAVPGDVVQLHERCYEGPITVPAGVTVRGVGWDRTVIARAAGRSGAIATIRAGATLANVDLISEVDGRAPVFACEGTNTDSNRITAVLLSGANAVVSRCRCAADIVVDGDDAVISDVIGRRVIGGAERTTIERCALKGVRSDLAISISGGTGHLITRNEIVDHRCAVRLSGVSASVVSENRVQARWCGVHLHQCDHVEVVDNSIQQTMRAIDVEGGNGSVVTGNWVADGDSGALITFGATDTAVIDNHVERCRIGVLVWDAVNTRVGPNTFVDLHEEASVVNGPDPDSE